MFRDRIVIPNTEMRQGTKPWFAWRREMDATATEAAALLRLWAPWDDAPQSWEEKRNPPERPPFRGNEATRHGSKMEATARAKCNELAPHGTEPFVPVCVQASIPDKVRDVQFDWKVGASLDGWAVAGHRAAWLEIKSPYKGTKSETWQRALDDEVDPLYLPQLAFQACLMPPKAECLFVVYCSDVFNRYTGAKEQDEDIRILTVDRSILLPYTKQLRQLVPMYLRGDPEPSEERVPLLR